MNEQKLIYANKLKESIFIFIIGFFIILMLEAQSKKHKILKVATLNYSGIITSPYEYHENQQDPLQIEVNKTFAQIVKEHHCKDFDDVEKFTWNMGSVDVFWKDRLSAVNHIDAGVKVLANGEQKMMNLAQFEQQWELRRQRDQQKIEKYYKEKNQSKNKEQTPQDIAKRDKLMNEQISQAKIFDIMCYRTLIKIIYNKELEDLDVSASKWKQIRKEHYSKSYLDQSKKEQQTLQALRKGQYDIFCFQETNKRFKKLCVEELKNYWVKYDEEIDSCDSMIVLKKETFPQITCFEDLQKMNKNFIREYCEVKAIYQTPLKQTKKLGKKKSFIEQFANSKHIEKIKNNLIWNKDSVMQVVNNLVIFSPHISSKQDKNKMQQIQMMKDIAEIHVYNPEYSIIVAGDLNAKIQQQLEVRRSTLENRPNIHCFPPEQTKRHITCNKKRTLMQPQRHKAEKLDKSTKDYIITDMDMVSQRIVLMNGKGDTNGDGENNAEEEQVDLRKSYLPNKDHPYDHFVVACDLLFDKVDEDDDEIDI